MPRRLLLGVLVVLTSMAALSGVASAQDEEDAPEWSVGGILRDPEGEPVEGAEFTVTTPAGEEIGSATSDEDGAWNVELPGPGIFQAELDTGTLPDGVTLRNEDNNPLEFTVRTVGRPRVVLFATGEGRSGGVELWRALLQLTVEGIKLGLVIAMASIGLSLIFGTTGLTNFAHGEMVTFGALIAWWLNTGATLSIGFWALRYHLDVKLHLVPAALIAIVIGGLVGALLDRFLWRPLRRKGTGLIAMLVVSIGLALLVRYIFLYQFGGRARGFADYAVQRAWAIGPVDIAPKDLFSIGLSLVVLVAIAFGLQRTRMGKAMRAVADNPDLASSSGIDVQRVILLVWFFGGSLAALGGILQALSEQASFQMGFQLLLLMFAGVTLGGLGTAYGALVGSLIVGLLVQLSTHWLPSEMKNLGALVVLIVILVVRPQGILGSKERVG